MSGSWNSIHPELRWCIEDVAHQVRRRRWMGAAKQFGWVAFGLTGVFTALMWLAGAHASLALALSLVYVACLIAAAGYYAYAVTRNPVTVEQVALFIDEKHPELENRITSAVDLSLHEKEGVSIWLTEKFFEESLDRVRSTSLADMVDPRPARSLGYSAAAIGISSVILLYLFGNVWLPALSFVFPSARVEVAALPFTVEPGNVRVRIGDNQMVWVRTTDDNREVIVRWRTPNGVWEEVPAGSSGTENVYFHQFTDIQSDIEYQVEYGRKRSEEFRITAWLPPAVDSINLTYNYPDYLGLAPREVPNSGNIAAVEGTNVDVEVYTNKAIAAAELVLESGDTVPLDRVDDTRWRAPIAITKDDAYEVRLTDRDDEHNEFPIRYTIAMNRDKAPEIKISFPRGDNEVNPLEEVPFDFQVSDDFGFDSFGVQYEIAGREPVRVVLNEGGSVATDAEGHHELRLEDIGVEVGDFITWSVWAKDAKPDRTEFEALGDPYFLEIKPFKREYREAVSAGGMGGMGQNGGDQEPDQIQKQILIATWNLRRDSSYMDKTEFNEKRDTIVETQEKLIDDISGADSPLEAPDAEEMKLREAMQGSADALKTATLDDYKTALSNATVQQQNAVRLLARMKPRDAQVQQQQGGGGGGGGSSDRPDISELEMARNRNFYEQESLTREQQQANDEVLNKIKELAQRQQNINEELAKLISELQLAKTEEERQRLEKELQKLKDEMQSNLQNLDQARQQLSSNAMDNQQSRSAQDALERARHQMNRSLELMDRNDLQQARAAGSRASDALDDVQDQLHQFGREAAAQRMRDLQRKLEEMQQRQNDVVDRTRKAQQLHDAPSLEGQKELEQLQQDLGGEKDQLAEDFVNMMEEASELAQRSAQTQELMSRRLGDWMRETSREGIYEDIRESKPYIEYGIWDTAVNEEQQIAQKMAHAGQQLQSVADSLVADDLEAMQKAMEQLDQLLQREEVARALEQRDQQQKGGAAGQPTDDENAQGAGAQPDDQSEQQGPGPSDDPNAEPSEQGQSQREQQANARPGDQPGQGQTTDQQNQEGQQPGQGQPSDQPQPSQGQRQQPSPGQQNQGGAMPRGGNRSGGQSGADRNWTGPDQAMRDFIENGYNDWLDYLNNAESLLPQGTPVRTDVTRIRERIEMMRRDWRTRKLAPQFDLFLEYAAQPLEQVAEELQREIDRQLSAKEFLAVDEGDVPERHRARVAEYFKRLSEAEGRP